MPCGRHHMHLVVPGVLSACAGRCVVQGAVRGSRVAAEFGTRWADGWAALLGEVHWVCDVSLHLLSFLDLVLVLVLT